MGDRFPLLVVGGLALLFAVGGALLGGASRGRFADVLSTWQSGPDGARALYLLASESGIDVGRHQTDLEILPSGTNLVLLSVYFPEAAREDRKQPARGLNRYLAPEVSDDERKSVLEHVARGHRLVYVSGGDPGDPLLSDLGVEVQEISDSGEASDLVPAIPSTWTYGVAKARAAVPMHLSLPEDAVPLLVDERSGGVVGGLVPHGSGEVVVLAAPELATNRRLAEADNAQLWVSLLRSVAASGPIRFDEFHHGFSDDRSIAEFARRYGLQFAVLQLVAGLCLWTLAARRFGRPRVPEEEERLGSTDALFAAARLYREGRHHGFAADLVVTGLARELALHAGLPARARVRDVAMALRSQGEKDLADELQTVQGIGERAKTERDVEAVARRAADLRRNLSGRGEAAR